MMALRILVFTLLAASALSFVLYLFTGQEKYRRWGFAIFKWTLLAILVFFGVLFVSQFDWSMFGPQAVAAPMAPTSVTPVPDGLAIVGSLHSHPEPASCRLSPCRLTSSTSSG